MTWKNSADKALTLLLAIALALFLLVTSVQRIAFDLDYFSDQFDENGTVERTGIAKEDLMILAQGLVAYLADDTDHLDFVLPVHGESREIFGWREKEHMVDVKAIFVTLDRLRFVALLLLIMGTLWHIGRKKPFYPVLLGQMLVTLVFGGLLGLAMAVDFSRTFVLFHELFFSNDLWLLDPNTEILIQMLPESFFMGMAVRILILHLALSLSIGFIGLLNYRRGRIA